MICALCGREGRGFCWVTPRHSLQAPESKRRFKRFCSMRCQAIHARRVAAGGGVVIDPTHNETAAMEAVLPSLGEYVASLGMERPLTAYSREEILRLVDVVLTAYFDNLRDLTPDDVPF